MGDIANKFFGGGTPKTSVKKYWDGNLPWIQSSDLVVGRLFDIKPKKYISENGLNNSASKQVPANSIAIVTRVGVGKVGYFPYSYATSQDFISFSNLNIDTLFGTFLCYKTLNGNLNLQGSSIKGITGVTARNFIIKIPQQKYEQFNIGQFMYHADKLITLHQRKCDQLKNIKKSLLEKLFPKNGTLYPELRFKEFTDAWEQRKLGGILKERTERAHGDEELLSVTIGNGVIRQIDSDKRNIASEDKSNYKVVKKGDIPCNSMRMWQGAVGNSEYDGIVSPAYTVLTPTSDANGKFFMELFKKESTLQIFQRWSQGLTSDTWNLKYPVLSSIQFDIPSVEEQTEIARYFSTLDSLITLHQRKCDQLKNIKKSLLEKLFPKNGTLYPELRFKGFNDAWEQRKLEDYSSKEEAEVAINKIGEKRLLIEYFKIPEDEL